MVAIQTGFQVTSVQALTGGGQVTPKSKVEPAVFQALPSGGDAWDKFRSSQLGILVSQTETATLRGYPLAIDFNKFEKTGSALSIASNQPHSLTIKGSATNSAVASSWGLNLMVPTGEMLLNITWRNGRSDWGNKAFRVEINGQPVLPPHKVAAADDPTYFIAGVSGAVRLSVPENIGNIQVITAAGKNFDYTLEFYAPESSAQSRPQSNGQFVTITPAYINRTPEIDGILSTIRKACSDIWEGTSAYLSDDVQNWAQHTFRNKADFQQFMINWANVETGGKFNPDHHNVSHPASGGQEHTFGLFQVNAKWATLHNNWGHDSNPYNWSVESDAVNPYKATHWALNHLMDFATPAKGNLSLMLEGYWHGTFGENSAYSDSVIKGSFTHYNE